MARVTVEDCVLKVNNLFKIVALAGRRARDIAAGEELKVERENDKNTVVSLREIAKSDLDLDQLEENIIDSLQKYSPVEEESQIEEVALHLPPQPPSTDDGDKGESRLKNPSAAHIVKKPIEKSPEEPAEAKDDPEHTA